MFSLKDEPEEVVEGEAAKEEDDFQTDEDEEMEVEVDTQVQQQKRKKVCRNLQSILFFCVIQFMLIAVADEMLF